jgi:hypothetical protein
LISIRHIASFGLWVCLVGFFYKLNGMPVGGGGQTECSASTRLLLPAVTSNGGLSR